MTSSGSSGGSAIAGSSSPEPNIIEYGADTIEYVQAKILYTLSIYPKLSHSMLQTGIGPGIAPTIWRPALAHMIEKRWIKEEQIQAKGVSGRANSPKVLSLTDEGMIAAGLVPDTMNDTNLADHQNLETTHTQGRP